MTRPTDSGLDDAQLQRIVDSFYSRVRADDRLGPIFEGAVHDWPGHLATLGAFWSSVMLRSGRYKGNPVAAHLRHRAKLEPALFQRWLQLWTQTTQELAPPEEAARLQAAANRIAESLQLTLFFDPANPSGPAVPARH